MYTKFVIKPAGHFFILWPVYKVVKMAATRIFVFSVRIE
jgi:hypothetical protein